MPTPSPKSSLTLEALLEAGTQSSKYVQYSSGWVPAAASPQGQTPFLGMGSKAFRFVRWFLARVQGWGFLLLIPALVLSSACGSGSPKKEARIPGEAAQLAAQGSAWYGRGCYSLAERYFLQALQASRLVDDRPQSLTALGNLGAVNLALGRYDEAGEFLNQALFLAQSVPNPAEESMIWGNLASLAYKTGRHKDAEDFWGKAVALARQDPKGTGLGLHLSNLAMLYRTTGRPDQADAPLQEALKAAQDAGSTGVVAGIRAQMGLLARDRNAADQAEAHFLAALELDKQVEAPLAVASDLEELGRLYAAMNRWPEAARELDRAIQLRATLGQVEKVRDLFEALKQTKEKGGQPASLAPYDRLLKNLEDAPPRSPLCR